MTNMDLTQLLELHIKHHSTLSLHLYKKLQPVAQPPPKKGKAEDKKRKERYMVYGTFKEQELTADTQQARIGFFEDSSDFEASSTLTKGLLQISGKVTLWADYVPVNICVCNPLLLKYCVDKKHSFISFFVRFMVSSFH